MEQKIYDVLCDIRTELSKLRSDMADVKEELKNIQGYDEYRNLKDVCDSLSEIKSDIAGIQGSGDDTVNLFELWDVLTDIRSEVRDLTY